MEWVIAVIISGLAVGAMYAMGTISLSMVWGSLGMLNMAHGALLSLGAYACYVAVTKFGFPWWTGFAPALLVGAVGGMILYGGIVRWIFAKPNFAINTVVATIAAAALVQNLINVTLGAEAQLQPFSFDGSIRFGSVAVRIQPLIVLLAAFAMTLAISALLWGTKMGRAIRAVSQQREAAYLMGIPVTRVYLQIMIISGVVSAASGLLLTGLTTIYPTVGAIPTIKALIICTLAGLGSLWGSVAIALAFGIFEVAVQYALGSRFGFSVTLTVAICLLVWRPYGLFGSARVGRI
ncbi:MAG: branched-chain amino acid ABC transporter permease [Parvibaculaceae bacterium]